MLAEEGELNRSDRLDCAEFREMYRSLLRHPYATDMVQLKNLGTRYTVTLLKGTNRGANDQIAKLLHLPSPGKSSARVKQYHPHPFFSYFCLFITQVWEFLHFIPI
jgi:hypothetical protein